MSGYCKVLFERGLTVKEGLTVKKIFSLCVHLSALRLTDRIYGGTWQCFDRCWTFSFFFFSQFSSCLSLWCCKLSLWAEMQKKKKQNDNGETQRKVSVCERRRESEPVCVCVCAQNATEKETSDSEKAQRGFFLLFFMKKQTNWKSITGVVESSRAVWEEGIWL